MSVAPVSSRADHRLTADVLRERIPGLPVEEGEGVWRFSAAGVVPRCVARPRSYEEAAALVKTVGACGAALVPAGQATHLDLGFPPRRYDVALCTANLQRIVSHDGADMTIAVEAGARLAAVNEAMRPSGQWLPFDPPCADDVTIGGLIAGDRNGPLRLSYGKVRDWLIGITVVSGDGSLVRGGGRVVKNVAGYDLAKLFAGSQGTLGVIVEAVFKVRPQPEETILCVWPSPSVAAAVHRALQLLDGTAAPCLAEAVNEAAAESLGITDGPVLLLGFSGRRADVETQEALLHRESDGKSRRFEPAHSDAMLKAVRDFPQPADDDALVARISALPSRLAPLLERIEAEAAARRFVVEIAAHAGNGVAWCQLLGAPDSRALALFAEWLRVHAREHGAWAVFEAIPGDLRGALDPWGFNETSLPLMAGVKRVLDPAAVLSPGRFVGGL